MDGLHTHCSQSKRERRLSLSWAKAEKDGEESRKATRNEERERERCLLLSWAKAGKDSEGRSKATRSEGDDRYEMTRSSKKFFFLQIRGRVLLEMFS